MTEPNREAVEAAEAVWRIGNRHGPDADRKREIAEYLNGLLAAKDAQIEALLEAIAEQTAACNRLVEASEKARAAIAAVHEREGVDIDAATGCADDQVWAGVPSSAFRSALAPDPAEAMRAKCAELEAHIEECELTIRAALKGNGDGNA